MRHAASHARRALRFTYRPFTSKRETEKEKERESELCVGPVEKKSGRAGGQDEQAGGKKKRGK